MVDEGLQDQNIENEHNEILEELKRQSEFLEDLAYQLVVYDPLERTIPINCALPEDNQAIGRQEIHSKIKELSNIMSYSLNVPLSNEMFLKLQKCFDSEVKKCLIVAQQYIQKAKTSG